MKKFCLLCLSLLILNACQNKENVATQVMDVKQGMTSGEGKFVPAFPDVPLPQGYEVDPTATSFFDTAEGRIAETYAAGFMDLEKVVEFYKTIMPQLGWEEIDNLVFFKDGEILVLTPERKNYINIVEFQLKPANILR